MARHKDDKSQHNDSNKKNTPIKKNPSFSLNDPIKKTFIDNAIDPFGNNLLDEYNEMEKLLAEKDIQPLLRKMKNDHIELQQWQARLQSDKFYGRHFNQQQSIANVFHQKSVIQDLKPETQYQTLNALNKEYNGLCEIISNYVIMKDLLNQKNAELAEGPKSFPMMFRKKNLLQIDINLKNINQDVVRHSHLLKTTNIFTKLIAMIFDIYPHSIIPAFSKIMDKKSEVNKTLLQTKLDKMPDDSYIKFQVFSKKGFNFKGHSMVIKKISNDNFCFFDPNKGEYKGLSFDKLCEKINKAIPEYGGTNIAFIDAKKYLHDLGIEAAPSLRP